MIYFAEIPLKYLIYPAFHLNRPRFLNTAILYRELIRISTDYPKTSPIDLAYKNYASWLEKGNEDLHLPAFKLTSRQMFWLSYAHVTTEKYQRRVSKTFEPANQLINKYMHVILKNKTEFRSDFKCNDMTEKENQLLAEFEQKLEYLRWSGNFAQYTGASPYKYELTNELIEFVESVLTVPIYASDLKTMKDLLKNGTCSIENISRVFTAVCPSLKNCFLFF